MENKQNRKNFKRITSDEILKQVRKIERWEIIGEKGEKIIIRSDFLVEYLEDFKEGINRRLVAMENVIESLIKLNTRNRKDKTLRNSKERVGKKLRERILYRDHWTCKNCGTEGKDSQLNIDHIIPRSKGGKAEESNLQTLCKSCNLLKLDRIFKDYERKN